MTTDALIPAVTNTKHYEAVLRISEGLSSCRVPEELAKTLANQLGEFLQFDFLDVLVLKENSKEIEWHVWGKGQVSAPGLPVEELPGWHVINTQEALHIADWNSDPRFPRLKETIAHLGINVRSVVRLPLTTPHRRLGTLGIASSSVANYSTEDIGFLQLIARVVAFAIDDGLNVRRAEAAQVSLRRQNDRLQLLLNLTKKITSNLELRELLRAIAANIREVMQCDGAGISLLDAASGNFRVFAVDFPSGRGLVREEQVMTLDGAAKRAIETLQPVVLRTSDRDEYPPEIYDMLVAEGVKSNCLIPLVNRGKALGSLVIARTTEGSFTADDVDFLSQAAG